MKKLFFSLIIWLFWFINFSIADFNPVSELSNVFGFWFCRSSSSSCNGGFTVPSCEWTFNVTVESSNWSPFVFKFSDEWDEWQTSYHYVTNWIATYTLTCADNQWVFIGFDRVGPWYSPTYPIYINYRVWSGSSCPECETCPTTWEILSWYILESSVDSQYCVENELCPISTWSVTTWDSNWSALFINWIQHASAPLINVIIPDNVYWDYDSSEEEFILDIGSGYDQEYIDWVIDVQSYRPTSEDFTQTFVGGLILFTPYVVVLLFVILVRRLIWRIFKTK